MDSKMNVGIQRSSEKHVSLSLFIIIQLFVVYKESNFKRLGWATPNKNRLGFLTWNAFSK